MCMTRDKPGLIVFDICQHVDFNPAFGNMPTSFKVMGYNIKSNRFPAFIWYINFWGHSTDGKTVRKYISQRFYLQNDGFWVPTEQKLHKVYPVYTVS